MMATDTEEMEELLVELSLVASFMREVRQTRTHKHAQGTRVDYMKCFCFQSVFARDGAGGVGLGDGAQYSRFCILQS